MRTRAPSASLGSLFGILLGHTFMPPEKPHRAAGGLKPAKGNSANVQKTAERGGWRKWQEKRADRKGSSEGGGRARGTVDKGQGKRERGRPPDSPKRQRGSRGRGSETNVKRQDKGGDTEGGEALRAEGEGVIPEAAASFLIC